MSTLTKALPTHIDSKESLDEAIADWIEEQFEKGAPLNTVADALSGIHYFVPSTRRGLPTSWKLFATWRKVEVPSRAPPLTSDLLWAMAAKALLDDNFELGALLLLGWHCMLRTGEMLAVRSTDLLLGEARGIVSLPASKGGTRHNMVESVTISDKFVLAVLHELKLLKQAQNLTQVPIWNASGTKFREAFKALCIFFRVNHMGFRGYSIRRGGATAFFQKTGSMEQTLLRGRWASVSVARLYLCDALSQLPALTASPHTRVLVQKFLTFWSTF